MAERSLNERPLLAQAPVAELAPHLSAGERDSPTQRTDVRRRASLARVGKRMVSVLFLGLGIVSMLALARGAGAAYSDGLSVDDVMLLAMLGIISLVVTSQVLALLRTLPGTRRIWRSLARTRIRRAGPVAGRPLLAQAEARSLVARMSQETRVASVGSRARMAAATAGWVVLTLVIMAAATAGVAAVGLSAIRSIGARGWRLGTFLGLGMVVLIGYGVSALSIGLIRSWFERRRRRLRRMLMRLLRYLLRGFDRSTAVPARMLGRFDRRTGLLGRGVLVTVGAAAVVAASMAIPVSAVGGATTNAFGPGSTSASTTMEHVAAASGEPVPEFAGAGNLLDEAAVTTASSDAAPTAVSDTTTTVADTTTTTVADTTTTTVADTTTTTVADTTTTTVADTTGPTVKGVTDSPDPIFTSGNPPDTSRISATTTDPSGVATITVYYRLGKGGFVVWGSMKPGSSSTTFGPFATLGIYEYRIMATDTLGNANCKTLSSCPGGTVTVIIP